VNPDRKAHAAKVLDQSISELRELREMLRWQSGIHQAEPIRAIARRLAGAASVLDEPEFVRPARDPP
jgi:hypothetical protein